jgi:hypothetical protein
MNDEKGDWLYPVENPGETEGNQEKAVRKLFCALRLEP